MMLRAPILIAWPIAAALLALAIGCSDPGNGILPPGVTVVLSDGTDHTVPAWIVRSGPGDPERVELPSGTRAVVVQDAPAHEAKEQSLRLVRLRLLDSPLAQSQVEVVRYKLRPPG